MELIKQGSKTMTHVHWMLIFIVPTQICFNSWINTKYTFFFSMHFTTATETRANKLKTQTSKELFGSLSKQTPHVLSTITI